MGKEYDQEAVATFVVDPRGLEPRWIGQFHAPTETVLRVLEDHGIVFRTIVERADR
ncbi:hypothetical protein THTE_0968 [Thermogutta terrifontis]|uniref:Uncharacterized protein n=1 Tax=Thermogutta terrifontis TaxID=1331910 RepID=A0A286RC85_9BACT|nr:hypothetical protein THTE_0968 [Thermogutta terrifontis]